MKVLLPLLSLFIFVASFSQAQEPVSQPSGYLVMQIKRLSFGSTNQNKQDVSQSFKVPLTSEFMQQFKRLLGQNGMGTGFVCSGGRMDSTPGSTSFTWWIRKADDNRWAINMWGSGFETINTLKVDSWNPSNSQSLKIKNWESLDMAYSFIYKNQYDGINTEFTARYVAADDQEAKLEAIPNAPVKRNDRSVLFPGDDATALPLRVECAFQEG